MSIDFSALVLKPGIDAFGTPGTYIPVLSTSYPVNGVFDRAYTDNKIVDGFLISTTTPVYGIKLIDFPVPPVRDDHILLDNQIYIVREVRPDGHGGAKLMLNLDSEFIWPQ